MKKTSGTFKPENSSAKLIESLRQSYKNKDLISKANNYENTNRGMSESKLTFTKVKHTTQKVLKKSEEPSSRVTEDNFRNKSKERIDSGGAHHIKINVLYNKSNNHSNSNILRKDDKGKVGENSNRSSNNLLENSKLNISLAGLITNTHNNVNNSPKEKVTTSNFSKFAHNAKHVKSKSISSNRGILSSLNMLKSKKNAHQSKNDSSYNNISFENTKENIINNTNKSTHLLLVESGILGDHNHGHVRNNSNASSNIHNQSSNNAKSTNKGSTAPSITKTVHGGVSSMVEIDSPEELHYFYVNLSQQNKNLAYKFENINFSGDEEVKGEIDL